MEAATTGEPIPQHMEALERANAVRLTRAQIKRDIHAGRRSIVDVIEKVPFGTETMPLAELLTSQRRWGRTRARKLLQQLALSENKHLGRATPRQRALLADAIERKVETVTDPVRLGNSLTTSL